MDVTQRLRAELQELLPRWLASRVGQPQGEQIERSLPGEPPGEHPICPGLGPIPAAWPVEPLRRQERHALGGGQVLLHLAGQGRHEVVHGGVPGLIAQRGDDHHRHRGARGENTVGQHAEQGHHREGRHPGHPPAAAGGHGLWERQDTGEGPEHRQGKRDLGLRGAAGEGRHLAHEPVALPGHGLNEPGLLRRLAQRLAQPPGSGIEAIVEAHMDIPRPDPLLQFLPPHQLAGSRQEAEQQPQRLFLERNPLVPLPELAGGGVQLKSAKG